MARMISNGIDVVTFLKEQHEQIRMAFSQVTASHGEQRHAAFYALRRLLAVHETAEEEIVHPAARRALPAGDVIVSARLAEENMAKKLLADLENMELDSPAFEARFASLQESVLTHAEAEEREEFEPLGSRLDEDRLERMRKAVTFAERVAPTRPHPGVESSVENMLAGPFASMLDRARDAISGKA
jgi:hemerythrin superfamily protein